MSLRSELRLGTKDRPADILPLNFRTAVNRFSLGEPPRKPLARHRTQDRLHYHPSLCLAGRGSRLNFALASRHIYTRYS